MRLRLTWFAWVKGRRDKAAEVLHHTGHIASLRKNVKGMSQLGEQLLNDNHSTYTPAVNRNGFCDLVIYTEPLLWSNQ